MPRKVVYELINAKKIREIIYEIFIYIVLLICAHILAHTHTTQAYYNNKNAENLYVNQSGKRIDSVVIIDNIYSYIIDSYLPLLTQIQDYDNVENSHVHLKNHALFVGPMRVRQIRVRPQSECPGEKRSHLKDFVCYPKYSSSVSYQGTHQGIAYDPDTSALSGTVEIYKAGGFWLKIPFNYNDSVQFFRDLYDVNWIDRASRLVVIESNFYYESDHSFEALKVFFEILPTGVVIPSITLSKFNMDTFMQPFNIQFLWNLLFYAIIVYYTYQEIQEYKSKGLGNYFKFAFNYPDLIFLISAYFILIHTLWHFFKMRRVTKEFTNNPHEYICIDLLAYGWRLYEITLGVLLCSLWLKGIRFFSFHRTIQQLAITIERSAMNIAGFFFVLIVTILAFGQMGKILFGEKLANFRTVTSSVISVLDLLMGNLEYDALHRIHPQMAPLYLFIIIIGILGILQNLFVAIFLADYSEVERNLIIRDKEVFKLFQHDLFNLIGLKSLKNEPLFIDYLTEFIKTEKSIISKETRMAAKPMRDLREELARIMESTLQVETTLENLVEVMNRIAEIQITKEQMRKYI